MDDVTLMTCRGKRGATCHLKMCESFDVNVKNECHVSNQGNIFKGHMSLSYFRKSHEWLSSGFRVSEFRGFRCLGLLEYLKRGAAKRPLKDFF
jgi:hypothetical protein